MIRDFHAHIYFNPDELVQASALGRAAVDRFAVLEGHYYLRAVGPHPRGSCQLTVPPEIFGEFAAWLCLNRGKLTIFAHPNTGDDLADHSKHVIWFGHSEQLNLSMFE